MSIKYKMVKKKDYINPEGKKKEGYYPQVVRTMTLGLSDVASRIGDGTTFSPQEIEAAVRLFIRQVESELEQSNHVCIEGFGTFSLTAQARHTEDPHGVRSESIKVKRVVFNPSKKLMHRIRNWTFKRV